jgi:hypothetical protein
VVAFTLALGVAVFLITAAVAVSVQDQPLTDGGAALLSTALGAVVGAVATYLGYAPRDKADTPAELDTPPPPLDDPYIEP